MTNYYRIAGTVITFCMTVPFFAQQIKSIIPYRIVGQKMIIDMQVNDVSRAFIFDTGGQTALSRTACIELQLSATDSMKVTDVNNTEAYYKTTHIKSLKTPDGSINFVDAPSLIFNEVKGWECFGVDGIIGSDLFQKAIIAIDSKAQTLTVTSAEKPSIVSLRKMQRFAKGGFMPIINMQIAPVSNLTVLFDTGCPGLLSMNQSDFEKLQSEASMEVVSQGYGEGSIGVTGQAAPASSYRIRIPLISVGATKFRNLSTKISIHPYTLLGVKLIDYGKVTIDYSRQSFYFEAFEADNEINNLFNNFDLSVKDGELIVSTIWSSVKEKVEVGNKVVKINGKSVKKYDFCESILNGIPELKEQKNTELTIQTANGLQKLIYNKE